MTSIRERMQVVLWSLLFLFLLSMTVGGLVGGANIIDQIFGNVNPQTTIARINGDDISPDSFNEFVNQQLQNARESGQTINDMQLQRLRNTAWDNLLQDILVSQEVQKLNLKASNEEVLWHLENNPPPFLIQNPNFQTDNTFDLSKYKSALANPQGNEWAPIEAFMKNTFIPNYKLQKMIDESIIITKNDLMNEFKKRNSKVTLTGIHVTEKSLSKKPTEVSKNEISEKYNENKDEYKHGELRTISYVSWEKKPSLEDSISGKDLSQKLYERASNGEDFALLANDYSMDPGNQNSKGGDLGWFKRGRMVKSFEEAAFNAKKNQIIEPVLSDFGYHVIFVRDKRKDDDGDEEVLASHILIKIEISPKTLSNIKKEAILFSYDAQDFGFDNSAKEHNVKIKSHKNFDDSGVFVSGLGFLRTAIRFAFNNKLNTISDVLENDKYFSVCRIDSIISPGYKQVTEVESMVKNLIIQEKVEKNVLEEINNLLIKLSSSGVSINELIKSEKSHESFVNETKTLSQGYSSIGKSNFLNGAVLNSEKGDILGPIETSRGMALVKLIDIEEIDSTKFLSQRDELRNIIYSRKQNQFFKSWIDDLKSKADIIDNRKYYF